MTGKEDNLILKVLERLPISAVIANPLTGRILWVNAHNMQLAGATSPEQLVGRNLLDFIMPEQHGVALRDVAAVALGQSPSPIVYNLKRLDGGITHGQIASIPMRFRGMPAMLSLVADVTERERAARELAESEERYRMLVETSPDGIVVVTGEEIRYASPALLLALGAESADEVVGRSMYDFIDPALHRAIKESRRELVLRRQALPAAPVTLVRLDGKHLETTAASTVVRWQGEIATQTIMRDVANAEPS